MSEAPEIPEANNPFEKRVAVTIAILAIILSFIQNAGDNGTAQSIVKKNEESNQWAYYQAKSIKGTVVTMQAELLDRIASSDQKEEVARLKSEAARYEKEKSEIKAKAEECRDEAAKGAKIDDRADLSSIFLQIAIVICSIGILAKSHAYWLIGIGFGIAGLVMGATLGAALSPF